MSSIVDYKFFASAISDLARNLADGVLHYVQHLGNHLRGDYMNLDWMSTPDSKEKEGADEQNTQVISSAKDRETE